MSAAQTRANRSYRARLSQRGLKRVEVMASAADGVLIKGLARALSEGGPRTQDVRAIVANAIGRAPQQPASVLDALRSSPLVGADVDFSRDHQDERKVDL